MWQIVADTCGRSSLSVMSSSNSRAAEWWHCGWCRRLFLPWTWDEFTPQLQGAVAHKCGWCGWLVAESTSDSTS